MKTGIVWPNNGLDAFWHMHSAMEDVNNLRWSCWKWTPWELWEST